MRRDYGDFEYQAGSWDKPRRVVAKVEWYPGELLPRVGFRVTKLPFEPEQLFAFYNQCSTAAQHIKEGIIALKLTRLSCRTMAQNEVRLQLHALAYNLGMFLHAAELLDEIVSWSLNSLQTRPIKIGVPCRASSTCDHVPAGRGRNPVRSLRPDPGCHPSAPTIAGAIILNGLGLVDQYRPNRHARRRRNAPTTMVERERAVYSAASGRPASRCDSSSGERETCPE